MGTPVPAPARLPGASLPRWRMARAGSGAAAAAMRGCGSVRRGCHQARQASDEPRAGVGAGGDPAQCRAAFLGRTSYDACDAGALR